MFFFLKGDLHLRRQAKMKTAELLAPKEKPFILYTELNNFRTLLVRENLKFLLKEFQFVMSLKI